MTAPRKKRTPEQNKAAYDRRVAKGAAEGKSPSEAAGQTKRQDSAKARGTSRKVVTAPLPDGRVAVTAAKPSTMGSVVGSLGDNRRVTVRVAWRDKQGSHRVSDVIGSKGGIRMRELRAMREPGESFADMVAEVMGERYAEFAAIISITLVYV